MRHTMKIWEKVFEARLRREVMISEQHGFMQRKNTIDVMWCRTCMRMVRQWWHLLGCLSMHCQYFPTTCQQHADR